MENNEAIKVIEDKVKELTPEEEYAKARQEQASMCLQIIDKVLKENNCRLSVMIMYDKGQAIPQITVIDNILNIQAK